MMGDPFWRGNFGPMLSGTQAIPFADVDALEKHLATRRFAAFFMEPVQSEGGRKYGTLFVLDGVQTGMYRTGPFLAAHHFASDSDMVILAKALSGGVVPVGAVLMTYAVYESVFDSLRNAIIHASTFSENGISMRAGLATLEVLERYRMGERATRAGEILRGRLRAALWAMR
ncbi:MAG TPA: aminotransferase class III-fold pyridoxal phosphate-dependent enzyme [Bryobacteraceae bacterium]|nr:aminotransferase class III-fold pyridoxal phosphate-dependent enzyme [Bryobacteraceae bacterium]